MKPFNKAKTKHAVKKIIQANYDCTQLVNHLLNEYEQVFKEEEKEGLRNIEKHLLNLSESMSKNI